MQQYTAFLFDEHRNPLTKTSFHAGSGEVSGHVKTYLHVQNFGNQVVMRAEHASARTPVAMLA